MMIKEKKAYESPRYEVIVFDSEVLTKFTLSACHIGQVSVDITSLEDLTCDTDGKGNYRVRGQDFDV